LTARLPPLPDEMTGVIAGARPPRRLSRGADAILRLLRDAAAAGVRRVLVDDGATLSRLRAAVPEIADTFEPWLEPFSLFQAFGVDEAIDRALAPVVALPSGGRLTIQETEALTAIDVDSGAESGVSAKSTALACDLEAAAAIGREVLLRDLAGVLVIDFVPLRRPAERARVLATLRSSLAGDDRELRIGGWTRLGLVELGRERRGPSLADRLTGECATCGGRGRVVSARWAAGDALREVLAEARRTPAAMPTLAAAPPVVEALRGPLAAAKADVEGKLGGRLRLIASDALPAHEFRLLAPTPGAGSGG
jgi:ribonuclease G